MRKYFISLMMFFLVITVTACSDDTISVEDLQGYWHDSIGNEVIFGVDSWLSWLGVDATYSLYDDNKLMIKVDGVDNFLNELIGNNNVYLYQLTYNPNPNQGSVETLEFVAIDGHDSTFVLYGEDRKVSWLERNINYVRATLLISLIVTVCIFLRIILKK